MADGRKNSNNIGQQLDLSRGIRKRNKTKGKKKKKKNNNKKKNGSA